MYAYFSSYVNVSIMGTLIAVDRFVECLVHNCYPNCMRLVYDCVRTTVYDCVRTTVYDCVRTTVYDCVRTTCI